VPTPPDYIAFLNERLDDLRRSLEGLKTALGAADRTQAITQAKAALAAIQALKGGLSYASYPAWIQRLEPSLKSYVGSKGSQKSGGPMVEALVQVLPDVRAHTWLETTETAYDLDALYRRCYEDSQLPKLFDEMVETLEKIIESDALDSRSIVAALNTVLATLRRHEEGSFLSTWASWDFARRYLDNLKWEILETHPKLSPLVKAYRKTRAEMDSEASRVRAEFESEIEAAADTLPLPDPEHPLLLGKGEGRTAITPESEPGEGEEKPTSRGN
jgi:hypothetical protein